MKRLLLSCLLCVVFLLTAFSVGNVYAFPSETITFYHQDKIFTYHLDKNIKTSSQFDLNYEINKYNRFGSVEERANLLKHMLSIGLDKNIAVEYLFPNLSNTISSIEKNIFVKPKDAQISINPNSEKVFNITPEVVGIALDKNTLYSNICSAYLNQKALSFSLPIKTTLPTQTKSELLKHTHLRADFFTDISTSSTDRKHNIKNALYSLNKIEVAPNEVFSFNNTVGRRTAENGYRQAKIIVNNEFVDGIGGGVCQVSSTLYNSALLAGLEIVEANKHSKQVSYVKSGFDAMVNFGSSDLKFKNNTSEKLTIITNFSSSKARIRIFGENMNGTDFKVHNNVFNIVEPTEEILIDEKLEYIDKVKYEDEFFFLKKPSTGMEIKTYRDKIQNGKIVLTELLRHDKYDVQNAIRVYGTKKREKSTEQFCA